MKFGIAVGVEPIRPTLVNFVRSIVDPYLSDEVLMHDTMPGGSFLNELSTVRGMVNAELTEIFIYDTAPPEVAGVTDYLYREIIRLGIPHTNVIGLIYYTNYILFEIEV